MTQTASQDGLAISERLDALVADARVQSRVAPGTAGPKTNPNANLKASPDAELSPASGAVSLAWVMAHLHERAFGLFLLILALPCCIPFLYGIPQVVSLPLMFVSAQIVLGRRVPWLPAGLGARTVSISGLESLARRAGPWLRRIEAISRPRLGALTRPPMDRIIGLALVVFSASIMVPLPGTNTVPGFAVVVVAMGLVQRDGVLVLLGTALGTAWIGTLVVAGATLASLVKTALGL